MTMKTVLTCEHCGGDSKVTDSRGTRRRRECLKCKARWTTYELHKDDLDDHHTQSLIITAFRRLLNDNRE